MAALRPECEQPVRTDAWAVTGPMPEARALRSCKRHCLNPRKDHLKEAYVAVNVPPMPGCCVVQGILERPVPFGFRWNLLIVCNFDMHGRMKRGPCS